MDNTWLNDFESDVKNELGKNRKRAMMETSTLNQSSQLVILLGVVFLLVCGIYVAFKFKFNSAPVMPQQTWSQNWTSPPTWQQQDNTQWAPQTFNPITADQKVNFLMQQYEKLTTAATKIWERTKWNSDRIALLATVNNHNLVVVQQGLPRNELILLNEDWTINRMPNRIYLDAQDQEFMKRFIRR